MNGSIVSTSVTSDTTLGTSYHIYLVDATSGSITLTLPSITADGTNFRIKRIDTSLTNTVTVQGTGGQQIDSQASITMDTGTNIILAAFNSAWYIIGRSTISGAPISKSSGPTAISLLSLVGSNNFGFYITDGATSSALTTFTNSTTETGFAMRCPRAGTLRNLYMTIRGTFTLTAVGGFSVTFTLTVRKAPSPSTATADPVYADTTLAIDSVANPITANGAFTRNSNHANGVAVTTKISVAAGDLITFLLTITNVGTITLATVASCTIGIGLEYV